MDKELLRFISHMSDFVGNNWEDFLDFAEERSYSESKTDELNCQLAEYLADNIFN